MSHVETRAVIGFLGYNRLLQQSGPGGALTPRGRTPKGLASMPPQSTPTLTAPTTDSIPEGYCQCGCGQRTRLKRGVPNRFLAGHHSGTLASQYRRQRPNLRVEVRNGVGYCTKTAGRYAGMTFLVDESDLPEVIRSVWCIRKSPHTFQVISDKLGLLHRFLMQAEPGQFVDHINGNDLDNRRSNLRICTKGQNNTNSHARQREASRYKGAYRHGTRWQAAIQLDGNLYHLGSFPTEIEAALAYDEAARRLHGDFARVNFPQEGEQGAIRN